MEDERGAWSHGVSAACAVAGAACLWAWGYVASLSSALFPDAQVGASIGIEFAYYVSQLTLFALGAALAVALRRWHPGLPPAVVVGASVVLCGATCALAAMMRTDAPSLAGILACGVAYGAGGMVLAVAWGARFSLGSRAMRRMVLLSFLAGYVIYLASLRVPAGASVVMACALPLVSGGLWLYDSWRRHRLTAEVWPAAGPGAALGEASAGSVEAAILPWRTMGVFAVTALMGNFVSSLLMGATYEGAAVMFPGAFVVCACITAAAVAVVGAGERQLTVERLYRYCLPFAVLGMLVILAGPAGSRAFAGALVIGASVFLQALVTLKVTEATQETGVSPLLAFSVGQGLVGAVVCAGNVAGRAVSALPGSDGELLAWACALGVFALFFLLTMAADEMAERMGRASDVPEAPDALGVPTREGAGDPADEDALLARFAAAHALTPREREVCGYLVRGRSLPFIAERLYVTAGTVKTHAAHIYRKTGAAGKQELMDLFERAG